MNTRILIAALVTSVISPIAFAQMTGYGGGGMPQSQQPQSSGEQPSMKTQTTSTKGAAPIGVKGYLDNIMANSKDKKFHATFSWNYTTWLDFVALALAGWLWILKMRSQRSA